jgi:5-methylcytosine-specific restriction endonuclease McrA
MARRAIWICRGNRMNNPKLMPVFVDSYLADTLALTTEEHGVYIQTLMFLWPTGSFIYDEKRLAMVCRISARRWRKIWPSISRFFDLRDGRIYIRNGEHVGFRGRRPLPSGLRLSVLDGVDSCVYCGGPGPFEVDHIVPVSRGGSDDMANLAAACRPCNRSKGSLLLEEWQS